MKIKVIASTKVGYELPKEEALDFSGKSAGICYLPDTLETLFSEIPEKTQRRVKGNLESGHHSVFGHATYNLSLEGIPKIIAMILNNEKIYNTSEKSARYTKMQASKEESELYEKWINIYKEQIEKQYPDMKEKQIEKLAMENARYLISVFTPATSMGHTIDFRQLNYILHWFKNYINNEDENEFSKQLKPYLTEFREMLKEYEQELLDDGKGRKLSLFAEFERKEEWGENYCCNYMATFAEVAQAQRHRTLSYEITIPKPEEATFFVPFIIRNTNLEKEWIKDIKSLAKKYPQGMIVKVNERGTVENFILKCKERLCGCAQLEIAINTKQILDRYLENTKGKNERVYNYLLTYSKGARCTFPDFKCTAPCIWGPKKAFDRMV